MNKIIDTEFNGFIIYSKDARYQRPLGVASEDYDYHAQSNYIPTRLKEFLVAIEDKRFYNHIGIDLRGITRSAFENLKQGRIVQGGSTISQQLARNLLRDTRKTWIRKLKETLKALKLEMAHSKAEILSLYFNNIYFGKNIWGIRTAGIHYFGKDIEKLTQPEQIYLLTILRGPNYYTNNPDILQLRYKTINRILYDNNIISKTRYRKNICVKINVAERKLIKFKTNVIPFIARRIDTKQKSIISSIDYRVQEFADNFVKESTYPVSITVLNKNNVIGVASSYGIDYPFISKSNVGSTLKPLIYCHLRQNGISKTEMFHASSNNLSWEVREVNRNNSKLTLDQALYLSNNNAFVNAAQKVGIDSVLQFLATTINKPKNEFYPSSILGATKNGISLYELALAYSNFFTKNSITEIKHECLQILNKLFVQKLEIEINNAFLKTGTTNNNKEKYAILGTPDLVFAILRNENASKEESKEGSFLAHVSKSISSIWKPNTNFTWI